MNSFVDLLTRSEDRGIRALGDVLDDLGVTSYDPMRGVLTFHAVQVSDLILQRKLDEKLGRR